MKIENNTSLVGVYEGCAGKDSHLFTSLQWQLHNLTSTFMDFNNAIILS